MIKMSKQITYRIVSVVLFMAGALLLYRSHIGITGAIIGENAKYSILDDLGLFFVLASAVIFIFSYSTLEDISIKSSVEENPKLKKLAEQVYANHVLVNEVAELTAKLGSGNVELSGSASPVLDGTNISVLTGEHGSRLYYRKAGQGYEIVGVSEKGKNDREVMKELTKSYS